MPVTSALTDAFDNPRLLGMKVEETCQCPVCCDPGFRLVMETDFNITGATAKGYRVVECQACRLRYLSPQPTPDELAAFYQVDYPAYAGSSQADSTVTPEQASLSRRFTQIATARIDLMQRFVPGPWNGLRVLDVGYGNGAFLLGLLRQHPVEAWGLDIGDHVREQLLHLDPRPRLMVGDLHRARMPERYFDMITLWHVLEHDGNPVEALRRAGEMLRPGGVLLAEVPNSTGLIARLCGCNWIGWDLPRHLVHFSPRTLRAVAERAGLEGNQVLQAYTLNPIILSPLLASLAIWYRRHRGRKRLKGVRYSRWDGLAGGFVRLVNVLENLLGGNGLLLVAHPGKDGSP
jgi:2-polyprenyl-3-methyl-5-hydroxy-6-metoxy-1,4-benzoquinol methylase